MTGTVGCKIWKVREEAPLRHKLDRKGKFCGSHGAFDVSVQSDLKDSFAQVLTRVEF